MATYIGRRLLTASTIEGTASSKRGRRRSGRIHSLMIGLEKDGCLSITVLRRGFRIGDLLFALPWGAHDLSGGDFFILNVPQERLEQGGRIR